MAFLWVRESQLKEEKEGVSSRVLCKDCTAQDKIDRGCHGGVNWNIGKYTYDRCPENLVTEDFLMYLEVWMDWKTFGFPFPGNHWTDQPCWVIDSISILQDASRSK